MLRVSVIDYLNALPLNLAFRHGLFADQIEVVWDFPSQCADNLAVGAVHAGLISSIEYQRIPELVVADSMAIAARGRVKSVLLFARCPLSDIQSIAVDRYSRSSVVLLQVLMQRITGRQPRLITMTPHADSMLECAHAALVIGDAAFHPPKQPVQVHDLALMWLEQTGLPFVFAFWAIRNNPHATKLAQILLQAKHYGQINIEQEVRTKHRWPLETNQILDYLTNHIHYGMGPEEKESLSRFYHYAHELGLIATPKPLRLVSPSMPQRPGP